MERDKYESGENNERFGDIEDRKEFEREENEQEQEEKNRKSGEGISCEAGNEGGKTRGEQSSKEISGLASLEKPEEVIVEVEEKKTKKKQTKKKDRIKEEIKLVLIGVYSVAGILLDECFYLKPNESEILADAIYRYLEEHNLLNVVREKSATLNLIIALISVNLPKILTYLSKLEKRRRENEKSRETTNNNEPNNDGMQGEHNSIGDTKSHIVRLHFTA